MSGLTHQWTTRTGAGGKTFLVDGSDPRNVVVKVKVHLIEVNCPEAFGKIHELEDAIEKAARTKGYTVDLQLVDHSGRDVFDITVDDRKWADSGNWAGGPATLAHELHHSLGLNDRYDYIESHSTNQNMPPETRLHWFKVQLDRGRDPRGAHFSLMGADSNHPPPRGGRLRGGRRKRRRLHPGARDARPAGAPAARRARASMKRRVSPIASWPCACAIASTMLGCAARSAPHAPVTEPIVLGGAEPSGSDAGGSVDAAGPHAVTPSPPCTGSPEAQKTAHEASARSSASDAATGPRGFWCFSWIHGSDFATDCFRESRACNQGRREAERGRRQTMRCEHRPTAVCTEFEDGNGPRCFGDSRSCDFFTSTRVCHKMSPCAEQP